MKRFQVEMGPLVGARRALWLTGEVSELKVGDMLVAESGEKVRIDAIGMANRKTRNSLSVLTAGSVSQSIRSVYKEV